MKDRVSKFMAAIGTLPKAGELNREDIITLLEPYVLKRTDGKPALLVEEVKELTDAVVDQDLVEIVDAITDIQYFVDQIKIVLMSAGIQVNLAEGLVCDNNDEKYSTSREFIEAKLLEWIENDPWFASKLHISENINELDGQTYYCLKDDNSKVRKFVDFPKVDLTQCIPKELL